MTQPAYAPSRQRLLAEVRSRFIGPGYPRLVISLILALSGAAAFQISVLALWLGLGHMGARYFIAALAGYATFLLLIRVWIALHRSRLSDVIDPGISGDGSLPTRSLEGFGGGSSGGGGASAGWGGGGEGGIDVPDADEAVPLLLAVVVLLSGLLAILYVVYAAPVLLAEVALDAALVAGIYRKLRKQDAGHWLGAAVRHTWKPALIVAVSVAIAGALVQSAMPFARTIGDVIYITER
jgi:hypothetical protein